MIQSQSLLEWITEAISDHRKSGEPLLIILPALMYNALRATTDGWAENLEQTTWRGIAIRRGDADGEAVIIGYDGVSRSI